MKSAFTIAPMIGLAALASPTTAYSPPFSWHPLADLIPPPAAHTSRSAFDATKDLRKMSQRASPQGFRSAEVVATDTGFTITMDTAGFTPSELSVRVNDMTLEVSGEHLCKDNTALCIERSFQRSWDLSAARVNASEISVARTPDGAMRISLPKTATSCRKVPIQSIDRADTTVASEPDADSVGQDSSLPDEFTQVLVPPGQDIALKPEDVVTHTRKTPKVDDGSTPDN